MYIMLSCHNEFLLIITLYFSETIFMQTENLQNQRKLWPSKKAPYSIILSMVVLNSRD